MNPLGWHFFEFNNEDFFAFFIERVMTRSVTGCKVTPALCFLNRAIYWPY